jgi:hypothetical protein
MFPLFTGAAACGCGYCPAMTSDGAGERDLVTLVVDSVGAVVETGVIWAPYRLVDPAGDVWAR